MVVLNGRTASTFNRGMGNDQRRADDRYLALPPARILRVGSTESIVIVNASHRGLFVRTSGAPPAMTELLKLRIDLPERSIIAHVVVVCVVTNARGRTGVGLRFFAFDGEAQTAWESFVGGLLHPRRTMAA